MDLKKYFPEIEKGQFPKSDSEWISIQDGEDYLHFPKHSLSDREKILLEELGVETSQAEKSKSAWHNYLVDGKGHIPEELTAFQFIYIEHAESLEQELIEILSSILGDVKGQIAISQKRTAFMMSADSNQDYFIILTDILPTLESDFGQAFRVFIGNQWSQDNSVSLPSYFEEENVLFSSYLHKKGDKQVVQFSELMLWSLLSNNFPKAIENYFNHCLIQNKDMSDMVVAMWQSQGNLVQSAQKLYIHRNSLQYKLDKLKVQSGLNLKKLDDLAFAYLYLEKN